MDATVSTLCAVLRRPHLANGLPAREWSGLVALARKTNLLGSLGECVHQAGVVVACNADRHLAGARQLSERQRRSVRWEAQAIHDALCELDTPIVLLKGAAYVMGGHGNAHGRLFGDIDILVAPEALADVEIRLMVNGWSPVVSAEYDDRYYRQWMHELPPMAHVRRGTVIDVHHTILPPTARLRPNPARIIERAQALADLPALRIPCPEDLIIHSIVHLVHEGSVDNGLRDLHDIWRLLKDRIADPDFVLRLQAFSREHDVVAPVAMGLRLVERFFDVDTPASQLMPAENRFGYGRLAEWLYLRAIADCGEPKPLSGLTRLAIYIRSHWLRMPPRLLALHLARKALRRAYAGDALMARSDDSIHTRGPP